ncbi:LacI family DNA-binding transcriptional regulator [Frigidibacter sp. MR17.14]|uniref:LacI family DNA-binding transcriptional regulator n=1 Tax=Frigidibacter sp. MR17.14 TaxID=3126509 RepID=UPI003012E414
MRDSLAGGGRPRGVRFQDIAARAGVSVTSVERVLNKRGSVSTATRDRVVAAAQALGIRRHLPDVAHGVQSIEVILPRNPTPFWHSLDASFRQIAAQLPRHIRIQRTFVPQGNLDQLRRAVLRPAVPRRGLIIAADATEAIAPALS